MKILIDQNISFRIIPLLALHFPAIDHVKSFDMEHSNDFEIYMFARNKKFLAILTLDEDFNHLQLMHATPPKIIWIRGKNSTTAVLANIINENIEQIKAFLIDSEVDCLEIWK